MEPYYDVIVVGAGLQGLVAAKTFHQLDSKLKMLIVDSSQSLGGVWAKERLYPGLKANNLVGTYEYTDFPMDETFGVKHPEHIPGEVICEYFRRYAKKFDIAKWIEFSTKITVAEKVDQGWKLQLETAFTEPKNQDKRTPILGRPPAQRTVTCAKLVVATGLTSASRHMHFRGSESFEAPIINLGDFAYHAQTMHKDSSIKDVTVYGGGKAAHDIVYLMATHGKRVSWIIRASGHGPTWMAPAHIYLGPFRCWLEKLTATRPLTWFSPCVWGNADGFGYIRGLLHATRFGRWVVDLFWAKLGADLVAQTHVAEHEETKKLIPDQPPFWHGANLSVLNYPTDIYELVRNGQVKVIRKDIKCLDHQRSIVFEDGSSICTDTLICSTGWKSTPTIDFQPTSLHADLGIPSKDLSQTQNEIWNSLNARADIEVFDRFPKLQAGAAIDRDLLVVKRDDFGTPAGTESGEPRLECLPWRLWRGIAPPSLPTRDIVFLGNVMQLQGAIRSEISSLWAYAYMYDKLTQPLLSVSNDSVPLYLNSEKAEREKVLYDTALFNRFAKWRTPAGYGAMFPDVVFDGIPYFDLLLQDLGVKSWRKGWGWLGEVFGGSYGQADYRGLLDEWQESQRKEIRR